MEVFRDKSSGQLYEEGKRDILTPQGYLRKNNHPCIRQRLSSGATHRDVHLTETTAKDREVRSSSKWLFRTEGIEDEPGGWRGEKADLILVAECRLHIRVPEVWRRGESEKCTQDHVSVLFLH